MRHIKKFNENITLSDPEITIEEKSITIKIADGTVTKITNNGDEKTLSIQKDCSNILDKDELNQIINALREKGGEIELNEDDIDEISKILFTQIVDKTGEINKEFPLLI